MDAPELTAFDAPGAVDAGDAAGWGTWLTLRLRSFTTLEWTAAVLVLGVIMFVIVAFSGVFKGTAQAPSYPATWPAWADAAGGAGSMYASTPIANGPIGVVTLPGAGSGGSAVLLALASIGTYTAGAQTGSPFPFGAPALTSDAINSNVLVWALDTGSGEMINQGVPPSAVTGYLLRSNIALHSAFSDATYAYFIYGPASNGFTIDAMPITAFTLAPGGALPTVTTLTGVGSGTGLTTGFFSTGVAGLFGGLPTNLVRLCGFYNPLGALSPAPVVTLIYILNNAIQPRVTTYTFDITSNTYTYSVGQSVDLRAAFDAEFTPLPPGSSGPFTPQSVGIATCAAMLTSFPAFAAVASHSAAVNSLMDCGAPVRYTPATSPASTNALPQPPCDVLADNWSTAATNTTALGTCGHSQGADSDETLLCAAWNGATIAGEFAVYFFVATPGNGGASMEKNSGRVSLVRAWDGLTVGAAVPGQLFAAECGRLAPVADLPSTTVSICSMPPQRLPLP